jgi:TatD DNase family protein
MSLIDTHAHLYYESMESVLSEVLERAGSKGVNKIVCIGTDIDTSLKSVKIAEKYDNVFATVGIHPHDAKDVSSDYIMQLENLSKHDKVVAIGEIGIDNFRNLSPINIQKKVMIEQMELAISQDLPIVFHNRDADDDIFEVLNNYKFYKALSHCFSSDLSFAKKLISLDILLSFSGNVTFKNATNIEVVQSISLNDFVLETDCPFLAPHPFRGTKNEPVHVHTIVEKIAEIRSDSIKNIAEATTRNAQNFFKI